MSVVHEPKINAWPSNLRALSKFDLTAVLDELSHILEGVFAIEYYRVHRLMLPINDAS